MRQNNKAQDSGRQKIIMKEKPEIPEEFWTVYKQGIVKELHNKKLLSDLQLSFILQKIK